MVAKTFFNSICFSSIRKSLKNIIVIYITNQPKFNSKLCRLLRHVLYERTSRATRKKWLINCYTGVGEKKCFLAIQHDTFLQFPDCYKFIRTSSLCSGCVIVKLDLLKLVSSHCFTKYSSPILIFPKTAEWFISSLDHATNYT